MHRVHYPFVNFTEPEGKIMKATTLSKVAVTAWRVYLQGLRSTGSNNAQVARIVAKGGK